MRKGITTLAAVAPTATLLLCFVASGCRKHKTETHNQTQPSQPAPSSPEPSSSGSSSAGSPNAGLAFPGVSFKGPLPPDSSEGFINRAGQDVFDIKSHPDAMVMKPIDPDTLTPTERQFGIAPRRDPKVEYKPDVILMEQGDKAIRSVATNGIIWTFDANAPHVNEFAMGKIVFATGHAVGRIAMLKRQGDSVQVILMPVGFGDLITKGDFAMDSDLDVNKMVPYVFPDFPQPKDEDPEETSSALPTPGVDNWGGTIVVSRIMPSGKWVPVNKTTVSPRGERRRFQRVGHRWLAEYAPPSESYLSRQGGEGRDGQGRHAGRPRLIRTSGQIQTQGVPNKIPKLKPPKIKVPSKIPNKIPDVPGFIPSTPQAPSLPNGLPQPPASAAPGGWIMMPGVPGVGIRLPVLKPYNPPTIPIPTLQINDLKPNLIAYDGRIGVDFSYNKDGTRVQAAAELDFRGTHARTFIKASGSTIPIDCGIELEGVVGVHLHFMSATDQTWHVNVNKEITLPISMYFPIAGTIPFSITIDQTVLLHTGFSARANSALNAEGLYGINGTVKAGYFDGGWGINKSLTASAHTTLGGTTEGISVGISSLNIGANFRVMLGLGYGPFNFGVFAKLIYTGAVARAADIGFPCRQGTMVVLLTTGIGYSLPEVVAKAVNALLSLFTSARIDAKKDLLPGPSQNLLNQTTDYPEGCSKPKGG